MTRATQTISLFLILSSVPPLIERQRIATPSAIANTAQVYLAAFLRLIPFPTKVQEEIVPILPLWGLVTFGAYLLFSLGWGVATFKDTEGAYHELMKEIDVAKQDLWAKGVDVD